MRPRAAALKALLDQPGLQIMPVCGDGMGARLIEEAGFRTGFVSGSSIAAMRLAMRDMDLLGSFRKWPTRSRPSFSPRPTCCGWPMATPATAKRLPCRKRSAPMPFAALPRC
jgi:hypothetical protein